MWLDVLQVDMEQGKGEGKAVVKGGPTGATTAAEKTNKQKKKVITVTKKELQQLGKDFIVQCDPSTVLLYARIP